jgi:tetratricopeptide (TPR) repeat protein
MFPADAVPERATAHNQLGAVYAYAGEIDTALHHYRIAIHYKERMENRFGAGRTRYNAALALGQTNRLAEAYDWAQSALRDYQACGNADQEVVDTLKLLEQIESDLRGTSQPS